jgi:hypothetical protein
MYFNGKYSREGKNAFNEKQGITIIQRGKVISTYDEDDAGRINVRIPGVDNDKSDSGTFQAFPMLPKHINVMPKKGDGVIIFRFESEDRVIDRMYMGPIIPQPQNLSGADYNIEAWDAFSFGISNLGPAPINRRKIKGGFPTKDDIALQGRKNSDLILKDNEVLLRAGKFVFKGDNADDSKSSDEFDDKLGFRFNSRTQGYIQIKYNTRINVNDEGTEGQDDKEFGTITNIVANKINLLTHKEGNPRFNLTNQDNLISDEEMQKILAEAHPLVFGDNLVEFLNLVKAAVSNHTHKYPGMTPHAGGSSPTAKVVQDMNQYDLEQILSKNIRIN